MTRHRSCWDCYWLLRVQALADRSTCVTRAVGAVAVLDKHVIGEGFNGTLPGRLHCDEGGCARCHQHRSGALEMCECCHAEANMIAHAANVGTALRGATCYVSTQPCLGCTKLIVSAGFAAVIYDEDYPAASGLQISLTADPNGINFTHFNCSCS